MRKAAARKLAELTVETITEAIRKAVEENVGACNEPGRADSRVNEIASRCARQPVISNFSDDEILEYGENGNADAMTDDAPGVLAIAVDSPFVTWHAHQRITPSGIVETKRARSCVQFGLPSRSHS